MNKTVLSLPKSIARGALFGAGTWSAYAVTEFVFSSVVFRLSRPYAIFPVWHWGLTALIVVGYLVWGVMAGLLAGIVTYLYQSRNHSETHNGDVLESITALTLVAALLTHRFTD